MGNSKKGQKGFVKLNEEDRRTKRVCTYLTISEHMEYEKYLKENDLVSTSFLRYNIVNL